MSTDPFATRKRIFASYSRSDADVVVPLCDRLIAAGFPVWLDQNEMGAGDRLGQTIDAALGESIAFIAFVGPSYFGDGRYTRDEYYAAMALARSVPQWRLIIVRLLPSARIPPLSNDLLRIDYDGMDGTAAAIVGALTRLAQVDAPRLAEDAVPTPIRFGELSDRDLRLCAKGILNQRGDLLRRSGDLLTCFVLLDTTRTVRFTVFRDILEDTGTRLELDYELRLIEVGQRTIDAVRKKLVRGLAGEFEAGFELLLEERQAEVVGAHDALKRHLEGIADTPAIVRAHASSAKQNL